MKSRKNKLETRRPDRGQAGHSGAIDRPNVPRKTEVRLGREVQARIGQQLRSMYDHVVNEGVPPQHR